MTHLAGRTGFGLPRGTVGGTLETGVAQPVKAAPCHQQPLAVTHQITDQLTGILLVHEGSHGHLDDEVRTGLAGTVLAHPVLAAFRQKFTAMPEIGQGIHGAIGFKIDTAAVTAITTVRTAEGNVLLAPETDAAIPAVSGAHLDGCFVDEFHGREGYFPDTRNKLTAETQSTQRSSLTKTIKHSAYSASLR